MFRDKLKKLIGKDEGQEQEGNNKRKIENLVFFIVILIITIVAINLIWNDKKTTTKQETNTTSKKLALTDTEANNITTEEAEVDLEEKLENILSKINGVGEVNVMVTYAETSKTLPVYNEESTQESTEEKDSRWWNKKSDTDR